MEKLKNTIRNTHRPVKLWFGLGNMTFWKSGFVIREQSCEHKTKRKGLVYHQNAGNLSKANTSLLTCMHTYSINCQVHRVMCTLICTLVHVHKRVHIHTHLPKAQYTFSCTHTIASIKINTHTNLLAEPCGHRLQSCNAQVCRVQLLALATCPHLSG